MAYHIISYHIISLHAVHWRQLTQQGAHTHRQCVCGEADEVDDCGCRGEDVETGHEGGEGEGEASRQKSAVGEEVAWAVGRGGGGTEEGWGGGWGGLTDMSTWQKPYH